MAMLTTAVGRAASSPLSAGEATGLLLYRNFLAYRRAWYIFASGFLEPVFYLFSIGVGVGQLVTGFEFNGQTIPYAEFVAPGMLAASAMNGAIIGATFSLFFKLKYNKLYDAVLATPVTPVDVATILERVRATGRALLVQEAPRTAGFTAEISARIAESDTLYHLLAPVRRLSGLDAPIPYNPDLEKASVPQVPDLVREAKALMEDG